MKMLLIYRVIIALITIFGSCFVIDFSLLYDLVTNSTA